MTIEEALYAKLKEVLGELVGDRVYPDEYPQPEDDSPPPFPCAVYQRAGDDDSVHLDGSRSVIRIDLYTVELWSDKRRHTWDFRERMKAAFAGANCQGRWGGEKGVWVCGAVARDSAADALPPAHGDDESDRSERLTLRIVYDTSK